MTEELDTSIADALAAAEAELGTAEPSEIPGDSPSPEGHDPVAVDEAEGTETDEQPDTSEEQSPLDILADEEPPTIETPELGSEDWWQIQVDVDTSAGPETVTLQELHDGYLRQADYTRKTQELADQRRVTSEAVDFYEAFQNDPAAFARYVAQKAGLVDGESAGDLEGVKIYTADDVEQAVAQRLQEELQQSPEIQQARQAAARAQVDQAFRQIETSYDTKLNDRHKELILQEAINRGTNDLDLVYQGLLYRAQQINAQKQATQQASAARPTSAPRSEGAKDKAPPQTPAEALERALAELEETIA